MSNLDNNDPAAAKRRRAVQSVKIGLILIAVSNLLIFSPAVLGKRDPAKYLVAFGLLAALCGASAILHGGWDWFRHRSDH